MARTAVALSKASANSSITTPAGTTADPTNGHVISGARLRKLLLRVTNTSAGALNATVKAGYAWAGGANGAGDLVVSVPATTGDVLIGPLEGARFAQANGDVYLDLQATFAGKVTALALPDQY